jgi:putative ABC transport system permease protein
MDVTGRAELQPFTRPGHQTRHTRTRVVLMANLIQDLRFALRVFLRAPRFTIPAVLALALGIGATSAIYSVVRGVLLKPLPYLEPDRIVSIWEHNLRRNRPRNVVGAANFQAWRERSKGFDHIGMVGPSRLTMMLNGQPEEVTGLAASADVFLALRVQPVLGRLYTPDEDIQGKDAVILLTHEFWQSRLGGSADILGQTLTTSGRQRTVVGIMPPGFTIEGQRADYMIPYGWTIELLHQAGGRGSSHAIARLRDGVSFEQGETDLKAIAAQREKEAPQLNTGWSVSVVPIHELMVEQVRTALYVLSAAVLFVLLIACVNVVNLLLARSTVRQRELGLRTALGATRTRLVRQMLTESILLALAGAVTGFALAIAFHRGLLALVADRIPVPRLQQVTLDMPVVWFTLAVAVGTGLLFGIMPALVATSTASDALHEGGRHGTGPRSRRVLGTLVVAEVTLSLVLLTGAGLLIRSFARLQSIDPGFRAEGVLTARVSLPGARYREVSQMAAFYTNAMSRIATIPGVQSAAGVTFLPMAGLGIGTGFHRLDRPTPNPGEFPVTDVRPVTPGFFKTMGIPQLAGRDFTPADAADAPLVAVVSTTLASTQFPGESPLGKRINVQVGRDDGMDAEIVGVVGDIKFVSLDTETRNAIYMPHTQLTMGLMTFVVRTTMDPISLAGGIGREVRALDPELPLGDVRTMEEVVDATLARPRTVSVLLTAFALIALVLAGVGVYGVMAYSVSQRTQEIGVRIALGATTDSVFRMVLGQALKLVAIGVVLGVVAAATLTRLLTTLLYNTEPWDPATFAATAVVLTLVAAFASYVPARRATRITPVEALRSE